MAEIKNYIFTGEKYDALRKQVQAEANYFYLNPKQIEKPFLTIVTACYNREKTIIESLNSTISQNGGDLQIIAIDDGSSDSSPELLKSMQDKLSLLILSNHSGISATENKALYFARGEYYKILDSDDCHLPGAITIIKDSLLSNPQVDFLCTNGIYIDPETNKTANSYIKYKITDLKKFFLRNDYPFLRIHHGCMVSKKELLAKVGPYNPKNDYCGDAEMAYHLITNAKTPAYIDKNTITIKLGGISEKHSKKYHEDVKHFLYSYTNFKYLRYFKYRINNFLFPVMHNQSIKKFYRKWFKKYYIAYRNKKY